jgi:hypothetical protein
MCTCIYLHIHAYMHIHVHIHAYYMYMYMHIYIYMHLYIHANMHICTLQVLTKEAFPREFAVCNVNIARALLIRRFSDRNMADKAIQHLRAASEVYR